MWVSGREAVGILTPVVAGAAQARILLRAGLAGHALEVRRRLYDEGQVRALAERPLVEESALPVLCPHGLYIARQPRSVIVDAGSRWEDLTAALGGMPRMPGLTAALLSVRLGVAGRLPWVATICGFVLVGADLTGFCEDRSGAGRGTTFDLERPGEWFAAFDARRLPTTVGGRPWHLWTPAPVHR